MARDGLTLTFDAPLDRHWTPASGANPVSGRQVTLRRAAAVAVGDNVTVSYAKPPRSWLRNVRCEYAPSFSGEPVLNFTGVPPGGRR